MRPPRGFVLMDSVVTLLILSVSIVALMPLFAMARRGLRRSQNVLVAAHLSQENNSPELAGEAMAVALNTSRQWVTIATQEDGFGWRALA